MIRRDCIRDSDFRIYASGLCYMSVCVAFSMERNEIEKRANRGMPTGISHKWQIADKNFRTGETNPCPCEDDPDRLHYLLEC